MDLLRGVSILLVTFNHAILFTGKDLPVPELAIQLNDIAAPIRMPLLCFLSGLLVSASLAKGTRTYLDGKVRRLLYPYLVWSLIIIAIHYLAVFKTGVPSQPWWFVQILYNPLSHLWFLYDLFIFYVIALVARRVNPLWIALGALILCAVVPDYNFRRFFILLSAFMVGKWAADNRSVFEDLLANTAVRGVAIAVSVGTVVLAFIGVDLRYAAASAPFVAAGIVVAILAARPITWPPVTRPLTYIGRNSLIFYLVHWHVTIQTVELTSRFGNAWLSILTGTVCGVLAGFIVCWLIRVIPPVGLLFSPPDRREESGRRVFWRRTRLEDPLE